MSFRPDDEVYPFDLFPTNSEGHATSAPLAASASDQSSLLSFLQQIGAASAQPSPSSLLLNDSTTNVERGDDVMVNVLSHFLHRNNLSVSVFLQAYKNESTASDLNDILASISTSFAAAAADHSTFFNSSASRDTDAIRELFSMPNPARTIVQVFYLTLVTIAFVGNCAVIAVYGMAKHWRREISVFHIQLAVADMLLALVCIPFTMQQVLDHFWVWPKAMCSPILLLQVFSVCMSIFTLVCIGIDRLQFVRHPLRARLSSGASGKFTMLAVVLISLGFAAAQLPFIAVVEPMLVRSDTSSLYACKLEDKRESLSNIAVVTISLTYILPLCFLIVVYACIGRAVWTRQPPGERLSHVAREQRALAEKRQIVRSLFLIVALFAVAWLPLNALVLLFTLAPNAIISQLGHEAQDPLHDVEHQSEIVARVRYIYLPCHFMAMTSTCINPAVYAFMHTTFRKDCRRVWHDITDKFRRCCVSSHRGREKGHISLRRANTYPPERPERVRVAASTVNECIGEPPEKNKAVHQPLPMLLNDKHSDGDD